MSSKVRAVVALLVALSLAAYASRVIHRQGAKQPSGDRRFVDARVGSGTPPSARSTSTNVDSPGIPLPHVVASATSPAGPDGAIARASNDRELDPESLALMEHMRRAAQDSTTIDRARDLLQRYGGASGILREDEVSSAIPITRERSIQDNPSLEVTTSSMAVPCEQAFSVDVVVRSQLGEPIPAHSYRTEISGDGSAEWLRGRWSLTPSATCTSLATEPPQQAVFRVRASDRDAVWTRTVTLAVLVARLGAQIEGSRARFALVRRGISLEVPFSIDIAGRYWAYAELWALSGSPVAFARADLGALSAGSHSASLLFGGAIVREQRIDGPFGVRNFRIARTTTIPPHESVPADLSPVSPPWPSTEVTTDD